MSNQDEAFEEAVWRTWRRGANPDRVSRDRIADTICYYAYPIDCGAAEARRLLTADRRRMQKED
jgi:hypothetical protein